MIILGRCDTCVFSLPCADLTTTLTLRFLKFLFLLSFSKLVLFKRPSPTKLTSLVESIRFKILLGRYDTCLFSLPPADLTVTLCFLNFFLLLKFLM